MQSVSSTTTGVCTTAGPAVTYVSAGTCTLTAQTAESTDYTPPQAAHRASPSARPRRALRRSPTSPRAPTWSSGGGFTATLGNTDSDGVQSVSSTTTGVCTTAGLAVTYVSAGTCTLTAQTAESTDYTPASGSPQTFTIGLATPTAPTISNLPMSGAFQGGFAASVSTSGDGTKSVTTNAPTVCTVGSDWIDRCVRRRGYLLAHCSCRDGDGLRGSRRQPTDLCRPPRCSEHAVRSPTCRPAAPTAAASSPPSPLMGMVQSRSPRIRRVCAPWAVMASPWPFGESGPAR